MKTNKIMYALFAGASLLAGTAVRADFLPSEAKTGIKLAAGLGIAADEIDRVVGKLPDQLKKLKEGSVKLAQDYNKFKNARDARPKDKAKVIAAAKEYLIDLQYLKIFGDLIEQDLIGAGAGGRNSTDLGILGSFNIFLKDDQRVGPKLKMIIDALREARKQIAPIWAVSKVIAQELESCACTAPGSTSKSLLPTPGSEDLPAGFEEGHGETGAVG